MLVSLVTIWCKTWQPDTDFTMYSGLLYDPVLIIKSIGILSQVTELLLGLRQYYARIITLNCVQTPLKFDGE
jgi:hypothetical protein